jgi:hypothetical protein
MVDRLRQFWGPALRVRYEDLVKRPSDVVDKLSTFAFDGLDLTPDVKAAVQFVDPKLRHHG